MSDFESRPRILTALYGGKAEREALAELDALIADWWQSFSSEASRIDEYFRLGKEVIHPVEFMNEHFNDRLGDDLEWEFCAGGSKRHAIQISSGGDISLQPLVDRVTAAAPDLPDWEVYAYRLPSEFAHAVEYASQLSEVDVSDWRFTLALEATRRIDITLHAPVDAEHQEKWGRAATKFLEGVLGEQALDDWVGTYEAVPMSIEAAHARHVSEIKPAFDVCVGELMSSLPEGRWPNDDAATWDLLSKKPPDDAPSWPVNRQDDRFTFVSCIPQLAPATFQIFSSRAWCRDSSLFCFLKVDAGEGKWSSEFGKRSELEDACGDALGPSGYLVGGGEGTRYLYVDLVISQLDSAVARLRERLQSAGLPRRSWLLFHDSRYRHEWVGVWDDTPSPLIPNTTH